MSSANVTSLNEQLNTLGIRGYLQQHQDKGLLRVLTCGSVDDGKSTLIGRLLHDSQQLYDDQLDALKRDHKGRNSEGELELAMLVDGLQAEREQGITIDVAYRYFSTTERKF
ncbi:MAG TPA: GTP-binding protein, partial [Rheinheimera sp.]|nr:GTP-binding protein [Rheinheimera sp.]